MKTFLDLFRTLNPAIQAIAILSLFAFLSVMLFSKEATANFVSIVPWFLCLLGNSSSPASTVTIQPKTATENISNTVGGQEKKT